MRRPPYVPGVWLPLFGPPRPAPSGRPAPTPAGHSAMTDPTAAWPPPRPPDCNAALVLADGTVFWGRGIGATGQAVGEVCFNTSITGYQEILTDPSYAGADHHLYLSAYRQCRRQLRGHRSDHPGGARSRDPQLPITEPANYRAEQSLDAWLKSHGIVGLCGVDTRRLTRLIRDSGPPNGVIAYHPDGRLDLAAMRDEARAWPGLDGMDLAQARSPAGRATSGGRRHGGASAGYGTPGDAAVSRRRGRLRRQAQHPAHARRARLPGHGRAGDRHDRGDHAPRARRHLSVERAGRPGGDRPNTPCRCCAS